MRLLPVSHLEIYSIRYDLGTKVVHFDEIPWRDTKHHEFKSGPFPQRGCSCRR
jgi:hypothetical protein